MSEFTSNAEQNVSAAKGVLGGYCYRAPLGTELPDSPSWTPPKNSAWKNMGYIGENGETFSTNVNTATFRDKNGDVIGTSTSGIEKTFAVSFAETKKAVFESVFGADNVTDENGVIVVHDKGPASESYTYVWLFLLKDGRKWVRVAESASITGVNDVTTNGSTELSWGGTFTAVKGATTGDYFTDYFESTETESA